MKYVYEYYNVNENVIYEYNNYISFRVLKLEKFRKLSSQPDSIYSHFSEACRKSRRKNNMTELAVRRDPIQRDVQICW